MFTAYIFLEKILFMDYMRRNIFMRLPHNEWVWPRNSNDLAEINFSMQWNFVLVPLYAVVSQNLSFARKTPWCKKKMKHKLLQVVKINIGLKWREMIVSETIFPVRFAIIFLHSLTHKLKGFFSTKMSTVIDRQWTIFLPYAKFNFPIMNQKCIKEKFPFVG